MFVVLILAVGIGANCSLFAVVNRLLLRPLPYHSASELVEVGLPPRHVPIADLRRAQSFTGVAAISSRGFSIAGPEGVRNVYGHRVTGNLFDVLGVRAILGRTLIDADDSQPVVMLSYEYWRRTSGVPAIIGQTIVVNGENRAVVGVLPPEYSLDVRDANLFVPGLRSDDLRIVARLAKGVTPRQAEAEVSGIQRDARVVPIAEGFQRSSTPTVLLFQATVFMVLLITCANVANLLLVRSTLRRREFAVRAAIGAGRWQIFRQLLGETLLLGVIGGLLGLLLAQWSLSTLEATLPANISRGFRGSEALSIDIRVFLFTACLSLFTVLLCGMAPAFSAMRLDVMSTLREAKGSGPLRQRLGRLLVIGEIGMALILLIGAGLTLKSLVGLENSDLGFSAGYVLRGAVDFLPARYPAPEQRRVLFDTILARLRTLPGVESAGVLAPQFFPFGGPRVRGARFEIYGQPGVEGRAEVYTADADYFKAVRIPLLKGRSFTPDDDADSTPVALISESVARRYWGSRDPIGQRVRLSAENPDSNWVTIVGITGNVKNPVAMDVQPTAYVPLAQRPVTGAVLMIRTTGPPLDIVPAVQRELRAIDPTAPQLRAADLEKEVRNYISPQRFTTSLVGFFAMLGLLLASLGIYAVMRFWVAARIPEIGIRIALGASRREVLVLVLRKAATAIVPGLMIGIIGAYALRRIIASELYGVSASDPAIYFTVPAVLGLVAMAAALLPARWAARTDPMTALRHE